MKERLGTVLLNRFTLREEFASGASATVYKADATRHSKRVVVKVAHAHLVADSRMLVDVRKRFAVEVDALNLVVHQSLVRALGSGVTDDGAPFIVLEYVEGQSMASLLQDGEPLPRVWLQWMAEQLFDVLRSLHDQGVVHRDVTPSNILLRPAFQRLVVLDLGIAQLQGVSLGTIGPIGTPRFIAPEQIRGEPQAASDVFSAGALLWRAWTGRSHLRGDANTPKGTLLARQLMASGPPDAQLLPAGTPRGMARFLCGLLHPDPSERPTAEQALKTWTERAPQWIATVAQTRSPDASRSVRSSSWLPDMLPRASPGLSEARFEAFSQLTRGRREAAVRCLTDELPRGMARFETALSVRQASSAALEARALAVLASRHGAVRLARLWDIQASLADDGLIRVSLALLEDVHREFAEVVLHVVAAHAESSAEHPRTIE